MGCPWAGAAEAEEIFDDVEAREETDAWCFKEGGASEAEEGAGVSASAS